MAQSKNQLWELIGQITLQVEQLMEQDDQTREALQQYSPFLNQCSLSDKLLRLTRLHDMCLEQEKNMRSKQLALMRERNLYLEKCRKVEHLGEELGWQDKESGLLQEIHKVLYQNNQQ